MNTYRVRYSLTDADKKERIHDIHCGSPISALNAFHRTMQKDNGLRPDAYEIKTVALYYNDDPWGRTALGKMVESVFDLPKCPNPDVLKHDTTKKHETATMPFYDEVEKPIFE